MDTAGDARRAIERHRHIPRISGRVFFVTALCLAWLLPTLVGHDPWKPDEGYSFGLVWSILESHDGVVPMLAGEPFVEKPPLFYLTAAGFAKLFSPWLAYHDGARLTTGFYLLLVLIFIVATARELGGRGTDATIALLASPGLVVWGHLLVTDIALLAGMALALYGLTLGLRRPVPGGIACGIGAGIAFLAKGLLGPGMLGLTALALLAWPSWRTRAYFRFLLISALVALPWLTIWPWALYARSPELFREWLWVNNLGRFFGFETLSSVNEPFFYFKYLFLYAPGAVALTLGALWPLSRRLREQPAWCVPFVAAGAMLLALSLAHSARTLYVLPVLLPVAWLAAAADAAAPQWLRRVVRYGGILVFFLVAAMFWSAWLALVHATPRFIATLVREFIPVYQPVGSAWLIAAALMCTIGCLLALAASLRESAPVLLPWALASVVTLGLTATLFLPTLDYYKSYRTLAHDIARQLTPADRCVASNGLGEPQRAMLHYFAGLKTERLHARATETACPVLLVQISENQRYTYDAHRWRMVWQGSRPYDDTEKYLLLRRTPNRDAAG